MLVNMTSNWFPFMTLLCVCFAQELQVTKVQNKFAKVFELGVKSIEGPHGSIRYLDGVLTLVCSDSQQLQAFPPLDYHPIKYLSIQGCVLTPNPLKEDLFKLKIDTDELEALEIVVFQVNNPPRRPRNPSPLPSGNYTQGLKLKHLVIKYPFTTKSISYLRRNPGFLQPLKNLTTLTFEKVNLPPIPPEIHLSAMSLNRSSFSTSDWESCSNLQELSISSDGHKSMFIPNSWPEECKKLKILIVTNLDKLLAKRILKSMDSKVNLQNLNLEGNSLDKLPTEIIVAGTDTLTHLKLYNNSLDESAMANFPKLNKLLELDLGANLLNGTGFHKWCENLGSVRNLTLDNNKFTSTFCYSVTLYSEKISESLPSLERLSLNNIPDTIPDCFKAVHFANLKYLSLATSQEDKDIKLQELAKTNATELEIVLNGRSMKQILVLQEDYEVLRDRNISTFWGTDNYSKTNMTLVGAKIECDCKNYWLARAMHEYLLHPFVVLDIHCKTGTPFLEEPIETMDCIRLIHDDCTTRLIGTWGSEREKSLTQKVDCHNSKHKKGVFEYPSYTVDYKLIGLNVSDNQITSLSMKLPDTLEWIDFRKNSFSRFDANDTGRLFVRRDRRLWLSNNQFVCDCDNKHLIDVFHEKRDQIEDFDDIVCTDSSKLLRNVTSYEVCEITLKISMGFVAALAVHLLIALVLFWRYSFRIKLFLYSRGLCLFCLREEDVDCDKPFDAFLSYAHGDTAYAVDYLLPKLEADPDKFRIVVHFRDWVVGDWIPDQIMKSIQLSKRTIIVLSRNFVGSQWGSLEFKYAVASASKEGRKRLLVLVLDDILSEQLDPELTAYIAYNTYLSCDDPWFWEKLRYAMPHKKGTLTPIMSREGEEPQIRVELPQEEHEMHSM